MNAIQTIDRSRRLAAPAPDREPAKRSERLEAEVHNTAVLWARWSRTRRLFGAPHALGSIMESLVKTPGRSQDERNARCDQDLARFQSTINAFGNHPQRRMFEAHYLKPSGLHIKALCEQLGVPRASWYRHVNAFARTVYARTFGGGS